jgi:hypothetical protein
MPIMRHPDETPGAYASRSIKKVIANVLIIPFLPVILAGILWTVTKDAFDAGVIRAHLP